MDTVGGKGKPTATTLGNTARGNGKGIDGGAEGVGGKGEAGWMQESERRRWIKPARVVDDDAFELVQPRRVCVGKGCEVVGDNTKGQRSTEGKEAPTQRRLWSDDISDDDGMVDDEGEEGAGGEDEQGRDERQLDPRQLRATFQEHARAVREMERRGGYGPALNTLRSARDQAERVWREAKEPAPLPKRLEWAEAKLAKAQAALTRARLALDEFDEETDRRRERLCEQIQEAERWYRWRQEQLDGIHAEAGKRAAGRSGGQCSDAGAELRRHIRGHVLPEVQAILEELQGGTAVHERLTLLAAGLADAEQKLGGDYGGGSAQHFDMYDDGDDDHWDEEEWDREEEDQERGGKGSTHRTAVEEGKKGGKPVEWKPEGPGRWSRKADEDKERAGAASEGQANASEAAASGHGRSTAPQEEGSNMGVRGMEVHNEEDDEEAQHGERSAKHRRCRSEAEAREEQDARRAQELHRQQTQAAAAQRESYEAGNGGFGSGAALSFAAQKFVQEVQDAQRRAKARGIDPTKDGKDLLQLTPMEVQEWVDSNLGRDDEI